MPARTGLLQIGQVAERTGLSLRTIRFYEENGLVRPTSRSDGGFRLYTQADVDKILVIRRMKPLGFSLDQMKDVMADLATLGDPRADGPCRSAAQDRLGSIREEARERRTKLAQQLDMADEFIHLLGTRTP